MSKKGDLGENLERTMFNTCRRRSFTAPTLQRQCDEWNKMYPVGTEVVRTDDLGEEHLTKTRSAAQVLPSKVAVIWVNGVAGCYLLDRIKPRRCRVCGCTTFQGCRGSLISIDTGQMGPCFCHWVEKDLCSACEARHG